MHPECTSLAVLYGHITDGKVAAESSTNLFKAPKEGAEHGGISHFCSCLRAMPMSFLPPGILRAAAVYVAVHCVAGPHTATGIRVLGKDLLVVR